MNRVWPPRQPAVGRDFCAAAVMATLCVAAVATTSTDSDFAGIANKLTDWSEGTLGTVLRTAMFLVGMAIGVVTQKIVIPLFTTLIMYYMPTVVGKIFGGVV